MVTVNVNIDSVRKLLTTVHEKLVQLNAKGKHGLAIGGD